MKSYCLNRRRSSVCKIVKRAKTQIQKEGVSIQSHVSCQSQLPQITFSQRGVLMGAGVRCPNDNIQIAWINFSYASSSTWADALVYEFVPLFFYFSLQTYEKIITAFTAPYGVGGRESTTMFTIHCKK